MGLLRHNLGKQSKQADAFAAPPTSQPSVFDRNILMQHTMDDAALATEVLALFEAQLQRLESLDWAELDLAFEMHTLRGAAAAVGAIQLQYIADRHDELGHPLESEIKAAIKRFRVKASH